MKFVVFCAMLFSQKFVFAEEQTPRDKLVKEARRVEKGVLKDLGSLREKGCHLLKNKDCVQTEDSKNEDKKEDKSN